MEGSGSGRASGIPSRSASPKVDRGDEARTLRALVDGAAVGLALLAADGRFLRVNSRLVELLGHESDTALLGTTLPALLASGPDHAWAALARGAGTGASEQILTRANGSASTFRVSLTALPDSRSAAEARFAATIEPPAASSDAPYRELQASEARLHALIEASPLGIDVMDPEGNPVFYNPMAATLHGIPLEAATGRGWVDAVHPDDRERVMDTWYEAARAGARWEETYRFVHPDGRVIWVSGRAAPIRVDGEMVGFVGTLEDITALKTAERELAELLERERAAREDAERRILEEAALRRATAAVAASTSTAEAVREIARSALVAVAADGALVERIEEEGRRVVIEGAAGRGTPATGMSVPYDGSLAQQVVEGRGTLGLERLADVSHRVPRGIVELRREDRAAAVALRGHGRPVGALVLLRRADEPAFRAEELDRARIFADLAALAFVNIQLLEESERRREHLERLMESRARLMRGFSHDVRNPLAAADGFLALLEEGIGGALPTRQVESVRRARRAVAESITLLDDLLEIARAEAGRIDIRWVPTDVRGVVREVGERYRVQAAAKGLALEISIPDELPLIRSDPHRVGQVLANLLSNAVKYTRRGRVDLEVIPGGPAEEGVERGEWVGVEVRDSGPGIPLEQQHLLFREFTRLDPEAGQGAGVGLVISRMIAEALGGRMSWSSEPGEGSTFTLWLPRDAPGGRG